MDKFGVRLVPIPWNKDKLVGQKTPLKLKEIWAIRVRLQVFGRRRELALFDLGIDSKLRRPAVAAEVGDRLEVRHQSARLDAIEIAVEVNLQHRGGMVGRTARRLRDHALKPQPRKSSSSTNASMTRTWFS